MPPIPLSPAVWHRHLADLPQAGFCHTPSWARIVREVWGGETSAVLHPTPDGQEALLPLVSKRLAGGLLRWTVSGETGVYGGPLTPRPMPARAWRDFWRTLAREYGAMTLFVPPLTDWSPPAHGQSLICQTHRLDLQAGDPTAAYNRGLKGRLNKARRLGLTVVQASSAAHVDRYVKLYGDTLGRWGERTSWPRPPGFFHALFQHGTPHVTLRLALLDGEAVAGIWTAEYGAEVHYLAGSTADEGLAAGGSHLLLDDAVQAAARAGCRWFDFGASGGWPGLIRFKESFGAVPVPYGEIRLWSPAVRCYWFIKDSWRRRGADGALATPPVAADAAEEATC
jgi:hypothetical protein